MRHLRLTLFFLLFSISLISNPLNVNLRSDVALLINADTGAVLYEKNADELCYPASITKVATALYAIESGVNLDEIVTADQDMIGAISSEKKISSNYSVPSHWLETGSSHIGFKKNEELSMRFLFYGMLVTS